MTVPPGGEEVLEVCAFFVGPHQYAVDVRRVDEVLPPLQATPLPEAPPPVEGGVSLRGERVPVVDLRRWLPAGIPPEGAQPKLLVCWLGRRRMAFRIDGVAGMVRLSTARLTPGGPGAPPGVLAVSSEASGVRFLLDLLALVRRSPAAPEPG